VSRKAIVFGATSYVGGWTIRALLDAGWEVVGVSRNPALASILLQEYEDRIELVDPVEAKRQDDASAVLNFAYIKEADMEDFYRLNRSLIDAVVDTALASRAERVVHTSTLAVFGYELSVPPRPAYVRWRSGDPYVESKILAEHRLLRRTTRSGLPTAIVRLGNVIGPGAPSWVAEPAQRILDDRPVGYQDRDGFSNTTYVENVADYLAFVLDAPREALEAFGPYHHLAELASHRWAEVLEPIARAMKVQGRPTLATAPARTGSPVTALRGRVSRGRAGGYFRAAFGVAGRFERVRRTVDRGRVRPWELTRPLPVRPEDEGFLRIMSVPRRFPSHVMAPWAPKIGFEDAGRRIADWVASAGYSVRLPPG
jgi:nucleoside-diphosphate-sugar epimerase